MTAQSHGPSLLAPGFKVDRYEMLCPLAEGGMASVWIARQTGKHGFEKLVAIKTILPKFAEDERFQKMFLDEAHVASRIEHGNVAQILDVGEQDDITYLVMEYVDGDSLSTLNSAALARGGGIPAGVVLRVMEEVCGGLHAAHELRTPDRRLAGVVHRDVSPQNVLVSTKGVAKLIDFGLAKARDRVAGDTDAGTVKGKLSYMAPEQVLGLPVDRRADLWAVGAILYHLLSGRPPYQGETDVLTFQALTSGRPPAPLPMVHPAVEAVIMRALTWSPEERVPTALEFQRAIHHAVGEAGLDTSVSAVTAFVEKHAGDRAQQRREAIAWGLEAASLREAALEKMRAAAQVASLVPSPGHTERRSSGAPQIQAPPASAPPSGGRGGAIGAPAMPQGATPAPRRTNVALVGAVVVVVLAVAGLGIAMQGRGPSPAPEVATSAPTPRVIVPASPPRSRPWAPHATASTPVVTMAVTDLPVARPAGTAAPSAAAPARVQTGWVAAPTDWTAAAPPPSRSNGDDGF